MFWVGGAKIWEKGRRRSVFFEAFIFESTLCTNLFIFKTVFGSIQMITNDVIAEKHSSTHKHKTANYTADPEGQKNKGCQN